MAFECRLALAYSTTVTPRNSYSSKQVAQCCGAGIKTKVQKQRRAPSHAPLFCVATIPWLRLGDLPTAAASPVERARESARGRVWGRPRWLLQRGGGSQPGEPDPKTRTFRSLLPPPHTLPFSAHAQTQADPRLRPLSCPPPSLVIDSETTTVDYGTRVPTLFSAGCGTERQERGGGSRVPS